MVWVPGSFEIPLIAKAMARSSKYDAILTLGAVVRPAAASRSHLLGGRLHGTPTQALPCRCGDQLPIMRLWPMLRLVAHCQPARTAESPSSLAC